MALLKEDEKMILSGMDDEQLRACARVLEVMAVAQEKDVIALRVTPELASELVQRKCRAEGARKIAGSFLDTIKRLVGES